MTFPYETDPYRGMTIDSAALSGDAGAFAETLERTLAEARAAGLVLAWLFLPVSRADLTAPAVAAGFTYHHADESGLQLVCRLAADAFVPGYATHYIGVGGVVLDDENRLLVIQERHHVRRHYKLPGGAVDPDEHLAAAVVREVKEETGIDTEFLSVNCFRHWHGYRFGKSDIYFVCRLKALSSEIVLEEAEIAEALWMPVDEYLNHEDTHPFNRKIVETTLNTRGFSIEAIPRYGSPETHEMMFAG